MSNSTVLVINGGSSSLKLGFFAFSNAGCELLLEGTTEGFTQDSGKFVLSDGRGNTLHSEMQAAMSVGAALDYALGQFAAFSPSEPDMIGYRVVHGGPRLRGHQRVTSELLQELESCVHFAPLHLPLALELIQRTRLRYPRQLHLACFDTVFHEELPETSARLPLPRDFFDAGIRRYGFHGLSFESILSQLEKTGGPGVPARMVIAHLGSGASLVALERGKPVDTTMGLTPTGGIPMATRSGDLDPGILIHLLRSKKTDVDFLEKLLNQNSGMKGLSGTSGDVRVLEAAAQKGDHRAALALEVFCLSVRKAIASYSAVLGGLDRLVFTGGIGENSSAIRLSVCRGLQFMGVAIDPELNEEGCGMISSPGCSPDVWVLPSQEDLQIARNSFQLAQ